jgi:hypothetical protein
MTFEAKTVNGLLAMVVRHAKKRERQVMAAARKTAVRGRRVIKENVPVAFGELREAVIAYDHFILVVAPHGAGVNNGTKPHWPRIDRLIEWVKLRGMQGLLTERQIGRLPGTTTAVAAKGVSGMLAEHEVRGPGGHSPVDAAEHVAWAIARAIAKHGTRPHHFIEKSMPELNRIFGEELQAAIDKDP